MPMPFLHKLSQQRPHYLQLMRTDRPIGTLLLLWPTLWALWIAADGQPSIKNLLIFGLGTFLMRSAGCVINDYADRDFDGHVERTKLRPLATGAVSAKEALVLFAVLCLLAFALVLLTNGPTIALSFAAVALAATYPFMKRHTHLPQVVLGAAFSWGVLMAFTAETGTLPPYAWLLYIAVVLWTVAYDTFYAMVDREDDLKIGIKSTAVLFGEDDLRIIGVLQASTIAVLGLAGSRFDMSWPYYLGLGVAAGLFLYQQYLARHREGPACFKAFLNNNWLGAAIFVGIVAHYLLR